MLKLKCQNGTLDVTSIKESRNFNGGTRVKIVDVTIDGQDTSLDDIEKVFTEPELITDFAIQNEKTGVTVGTFKGYSINNITRDTQSDRSSIFVNFMKGSN